MNPDRIKFQYLRCLFVLRSCITPPNSIATNHAADFIKPDEAKITDSFNREQKKKAEITSLQLQKVLVYGLKKKKKKKKVARRNSVGSTLAIYSKSIITFDFIFNGGG